jgi:hypothetical protein
LPYWMFWISSWSLPVQPERYHLVRHRCQFEWNVFFLSNFSVATLSRAGTMLAIIVMWFLISLPLALGGSIMASRKGPLRIPVRVNQIPRQIPPTVWYMKFWPSALMAGILPFGAGFIECGLSGYNTLKLVEGAISYHELSSYRLLICLHSFQVTFCCRRCSGIKFIMLLDSYS